MKLQRIKTGEEVKITFIPETEKEKLIMGGLRNYFFFGFDDDKTYPQYDGMTSEGNYVTSLSLKYKNF